MRPDSELQLKITEVQPERSPLSLAHFEKEDSGQFQVQLGAKTMGRTRIMFFYTLCVVLFLASGLPAFGLLWLFNSWHIASILDLTVSSRQVFLLLYIYSSGAGLLLLIPVLCLTATETFLASNAFSLHIGEAGIKRISSNSAKERFLRESFDGISTLVETLKLWSKNDSLNWLCLMFRICRSNDPVPWESIYKAAIVNQWSEDYIEIRAKGPQRFILPLEGLSTNQRRQVVRSLRRWLGERRVVGQLYADKDEFKAIRKSKKKRRFGWLSRLGFTDIWFSQIEDRRRSNVSDVLEPDTWLQNKTVKIVDSIGTGGLANVYIAEEYSEEYFDGKRIVLKEFILSTDGDEVENQSLIPFENELVVLSKLDCPYMVRGLGQIVEDHRAYIKLEYIDGVTIQDWVANHGKMSELEVVELAKLMCKMLIHLGSKGIVHRDFTPHNLILTKDGDLKLIDFNASLHAYRKADERDDVVGKPDYIPPEQFRGRATTQSDIYAMGATLFYMLTGTPPEPISQSSPRTLNSDLSNEINEIVRKATALQMPERYVDADVLLADLLVIGQENVVELKDSG